MRLRHIVVGCTLTGALGCLALPPATAWAGNKMPHKTTLSITAPKTVVYGANVVISGRLKFGAVTPSAHTLVTVTRTGRGTVSKTFIERTGPAGGFSLTDHHPAKAHYIYTARFAGNATAAKATASARVTVTAIKPKLAISAPAADYRYGTRVAFTVTLGPTFADRKVALYASPYGGGRRLVATGHVSAAGRWHPTYTITRKTTFTVVFAGDSHNTANSAHTTLQAYAKVADQISGFFQMTEIGGVTYDIFHGSGTLTLYSTVSPAKHGECLEPESEQLDGKTWDADTKYGCDQLDAQSQDTAPFTVNQAAGDRYRIRGDYRHSAKDLGNLNQQGPWLYFEVVK
jgi:hypothetical protein